MLSSPGFTRGFTGNKRRRLIPETELAHVLRQPRHGYETRTVTITRSDGTTIERRLVMKKEG